MSTTQEIEARIRAFVADIEALVRRDIVNDVREEALQAVAASFGAKVGTAAPRPAKAAAPARRGRPKGSKNKKAARKAAPAKAKAAAPAKAAKVAKAKVAKAAPKRTGARKKGEKRTRAELDQIEAALHEYVKANPGLGIEKIGKGMNMPTSELNRPMKKLIAKGSVRFTGEKRATKYFPGAGGGAKKAAKSPARKGRKK